MLCDLHKYVSCEDCRLRDDCEYIESQEALMDSPETEAWIAEVDEAEASPAPTGWPW